jgi:HK97 family phage prohead protease
MEVKMPEKNEIEKRSFEFDIEVRADGEDNAKLKGHAALFNEWADIRFFGENFRERILPGAFTEAIKRDDVRALFNHDANIVLGRNRSGTLRMNEDQTGLAIEIDTPQTQFASDLTTLIKRGDVSQMSFAFQVTEDEWRYYDDKPDERDIKKVKLYDISPVTYPAYEGTDIALARRSKAFADREMPVEARNKNILKRKLNLMKMK